MEPFLVLLSLAVGAVALVLPVVNAVMAASARRRIADLTRESADREEKLQYLYRQVQALERQLASLSREAPSTTSPLVPMTPRSDLAAAPAHDTSPAADAPAAAPAAEGPDLAASGAPPHPEPLEAPLHVPSAQPPAAPPADAAPSPAPAHEPLPPPVPLEQRLAAWFTRIGAVALLLGVLYFFKYAVDNEWIGPMGRVLLGALTGAGILGIAEAVAPKTRPAWTHALIGTGLAVLFVSAYASSAFYALVSTQVAFAATAVLLALGIALAARHRGEAILVLVLLGGFASPVLLSTGEDRALALFAYLLVLTAGALTLAARLGFRMAIVLSMAGTVVLAIGWYDRYFEVFDLSGSTHLDLPAERMFGAYYSLAARVVPLSFAALFAAEWLLVAFRLRGHAELARWPERLATAALVVLHVAVAGLLFDRPLELAGAMLLVGLASILAMRALQALRLLMVPMIAAFAVFASLADDAKGREPTILLALLGVWTALYVVAFIRDAARQHPVLPARDAARALAALGLFGVLAALLFASEGRHVAAALAIALASLVAGELAVRAASARLGLVAAGAGLLLLLWVARPGPARPTWDPALLAIAAAWGLGTLRAAWRVRRVAADDSRDALATAALALLGALAVGLVSTDDGASTLRALLTAGAGAASLALASLAARRVRDEPALELWVTALSALSLGLFAPAIGFGFSGATITALWAALTAVTSLLAARTRQRTWLGVTLALGALTAGRAVLVDVGGAASALALFPATVGREGVLSLRSLFNERAYGLLGAGVGLLVSAATLGRARRVEPGTPAPPLLSGIAGAFAVVGHAFLTALLVSEVRGALAELPTPPPMLLDQAEFAHFWASVEQARDQQRGLLAMATTLVLGAVALVLLVGGFVARDAFHRWLGLLVFVGTIGKLVGWDVWNLPRLYQVVVLTVVGALLLGSGFLYARLKVLFRGPTSAALALLLAWPGAARAQAGSEPSPPPARRLEVEFYSHQAPLLGIDGPGDYAVRVTPALYARSTSSDLLADVRIVDADGRVVPMVLRTLAPDVERAWRTGELRDPGVLPDGSLRADFEVAEAGDHCEAELDVRGSGPFVYRVKVETGRTPQELAVIATGELIWRLQSSDTASSRSRVRYPRSQVPHVRFTLSPSASNAPVEGEAPSIAGARFSCGVTPAAPIEPELVPLELVKREEDPARKETVLELDAGTEGVPLEALRFEIATPELLRHVTVEASSHRSAWPTADLGVLSRSADAPNEAALEIGLPELRKRWLRVRIQNRDDAPLDITRVLGVLPRRELVLRARAGGPHQLYTGNPKASAGSYDLAWLMDRRPDSLETRTATVGAVAPNPRHGAPEPATELPATERHRGPIGAALVVLLAGLAVWAVRLLRSEGGRGDRAP